MLAGVCAGIAERFRLDVTLVRIAAVVLALLSGAGVVAYVAAWLLTPSDDGGPAPLQPDSRLAGAVRTRGGRLLRRGPAVALIVLAAFLVVGLLRHLWFGIPIGLVLVASLALLVLGTRAGRWAAAAVVAVLALLLAVVGVFGGEFGTRSVHVASVDDLHDSYDYGAGSLRLDLSQLSGVTGEHDTNVHVGRGDVVVTLPRDVPVVVHGRAGIGSVTVDGHRVGGLDAEQTRPIGAGAGTSPDKLVIDVNVGVGSVTFRS